MIYIYILTIFPLKNSVDICTDTSKHTYISRIIKFYVIYRFIKPMLKIFIYIFLYYNLNLNYNIITIFIIFYIITLTLSKIFFNTSNT